MRSSRAHAQEKDELVGGRRRRGRGRHSRAGESVAISFRASVTVPFALKLPPMKNLLP